MAEFSFINSSRFRPFSYQEMLQPLQAYTNEYNTIQEGIGELSTKAGVFEQLANEQVEPEAYATYKQYANDLASQAASLAKEGLTPASRQGLLNMRRRYSSDIIPIEQAYKRRLDLTDEQRKARLQDSTIMFSRPAEMLSLDELIRNPALSPQSYSGALLTKNVSNAASSLAKSVRANRREWEPILGRQYYETLERRGFKANEVLQAVMNNPKASPELRRLVEDEISSSGIADWGDENLLNQAYDYARKGLWSAIGDDRYQTVSNKAYDLEAARRASGPDDTIQTPTYRSVPRTSIDVEKKTSELNDDLDFIRKFKADKSILNTVVREAVPGSFTSYGVVTEPTYRERRPVQERLKELGKKYGTKNIDQIERQIQDSINSSAIRDFVYKPNITQSDLIAQVIKENARSISGDSGFTGLYELEDGKKGDPVKLKNLSDYFTGDMDLTLDTEVGLILNSTDNKGKTRKVVLDPEVIDDADRNVAGYLKNIQATLTAGEYEAANYYIRNFMNYLDGKFNTLVKRESNTGK